jgi:hypothetical protein
MIKDDILPEAIMYFTGKAQERDLDTEDELDEEDDDTEEEIDLEEEDEHEHKKRRVNGN